MDQPTADTPLSPNAKAARVDQMDQPLEEIPPLELLRSLFWEILTVIVPAVILAFVIHQFVAETTVVFGQSMEPQLLPRQRLVVEKVTYRFTPPQRGQMVVVTVEEDGANLIKRVVGNPGETVEMEDGTVLVNGVPLTEPYVILQSRENSAPIALGPTEYFVLGDNRPNSRDSRQFGPVDRKAILGRAWLRYWPLPLFEFFAN